MHMQVHASTCMPMPMHMHMHMHAHLSGLAYDLGLRDGGIGGVGLVHSIIRCCGGAACEDTHVSAPSVTRCDVPVDMM